MTRTTHRFLRTSKKRLAHTFHAFFWHSRPSCTFSFTKVPCCLKLLIPASNSVGRWEISFELWSKCTLNWNNWLMPHKLQHTKRFLLGSRRYRCVTSHTEREEGSGIAHEQKTWTPAVSFHAETYLCMRFQSRNGRFKPLQSFWYTL